MNPPDTTVLLHGQTTKLLEIQRVLQNAGLKTWSGPVADSPGSGWGARAWLAVASTETERAQQIYDDWCQAGLDAGARRRAAQVADFDAAETECPACGTRFATAGRERCPDCGIRFA